MEIKKIFIQAYKAWAEHKMNGREGLGLYSAIGLFYDAIEDATPAEKAKIQHHITWMLFDADASRVNNNKVIRGA